MSYAVLTPAYGRDYTSKKAAVADFDAGKDFMMQPEGRYADKASLKQAGFSSVNIRYSKNRKVCVVQL